MKKIPRQILWGAGIVIVLAAAAVVATARWSRVSTENTGIPYGRVRRGNLELTVHATGELRATHTATLNAPSIGGGSLQITRLLHTGTSVKKEDIVIEFNPSEQQYKTEQNRSELLQAEQEIIKAKADNEVQKAKDRVALLKARFDVRRAELEVGKNELASAIDAKKNDLALDQFRRALAQLEQDILSHAASGKANIGLAEEKRNKAKLAMQQAQQNIEKMKVRAPMDGVVAIEKNREGDFFFGGMSIPDYHEGDQTNPGSAIARVIDPREMEVNAKIAERDRGNVRVGQSVNLQFDALPGSSLRGTVKTIGAMASRNFWDDEAGGMFDITVQVPGSDPRLRAGFTAQVIVVGDEQKNVLYVPRQALFMNDGKRVVYVKNGNGSEAREVKVEAESESRAAISGLTDGSEVALVNPAAPRKAAGSSSSGPIGGGVK